MENQKYLVVLLTEFHRPGFWRDILAEFVATFLLVASQLLIHVDWSPSGTDPEEYRAFLYAKATAGYCLAIACLVWAFWEFGGSHMNPAVTFAFAIALRMTFHKAAWYIVVQVLASIVATAFARALTPADKLNSMTWLPHVTNELSIWQTYGIEVFSSCILVIAYLSCSNTYRKNTRMLPSLPIAAAAGVAMLTAYWTSGAILNPVRAFGPAVLWSTFDHQLLYWLGPLSGAALAAFIYFICLDSVDRFNSTGSSMIIDTRGELKLGPLIVQYSVPAARDDHTSGQSTSVVQSNASDTYQRRPAKIEEIFLG